MIHVEITEDPIELEVFESRLPQPECGAVLSFRGVVRNHADGRSVAEIDYTCYRSMAESELRALAESLATKHEVRDLVVIHRIGLLALGEASLGILVSSAHRREAFACAMELIDEIKRVVPIWKKEHGPHGSNWV